jgi:hypothetical protein
MTTTVQRGSPRMTLTPALLGIVMYFIPWLAAGGAGLTFGAYDLAEWASLHPLAATSSPSLLASLLLRLPLVILAWIIALNRPTLLSVGWWLSALLVVIVTLFSLSPVEFFTEALENPNYRQQFILATAAVTGGVIGLSGLLSPFRPYLTMVLGMVGIATCIGGLFGAYTFMQGFEVSIAPGAGFVGTCLVFMTIIIQSMIAARNRRG